jgi:hypothetical protein
MGNLQCNLQIPLFTFTPYTCSTFTHLNVAQCLFEVFDEVVHVFDADA